MPERGLEALAWHGMAWHGMAESVWASSRYEAGCPETSGITTEKRAKSSARRGSSPVNHCSKNRCSSTISFAHLCVRA